MLGFSRDNLRKSNETPWLILDLVMLGVLLVNLIWLIFDSLYGTDAVRSFFINQFPGFVSGYDPIHENFLFVDLVFIGIFLSEFVLRWIVSIVRKEHLRWYFFPFLRWYDLVGCIPLASTRLFRFLRIFSILYRLHKFEIIDLNRTAIYRFFAFYMDVFIEELSDRIVVKVLSDAQKDIAAGSPLIEDVQQNVLAPRLPIVSQYVAGVLNHVGASIRDSEHGGLIKEHVRQSVGKAVRKNNEVSNFGMLPFVGSTIEKTLESAVTDIVTVSLVNLLTDINPEKVDTFLTEGMADFTPENDQLEAEMLNVVNECIELIKSHVSEQRWKTELQQKS